MRPDDELGLWLPIDDAIDGIGECVPNEMSESESESESGDNVGCKWRPPKAFDPFPDNGGWFNLQN